MSDEVIPLFGQSKIPATRPGKRQQKNDTPKDKPVAPSAALVAAQAQAKRKCWVCRSFDALPGTRYCKTHNNAFYRWLNCIGEGCQAVGERRIAGQTIYRCPKHAVSLQAEPLDENRQHVRSSPAQLEDGRSRRDSESIRPRPLKRPPYNIGHAY